MEGPPLTLTKIESGGHNLYKMNPIRPSLVQLALISLLSRRYGCPYMGAAAAIWGGSHYSVRLEFGTGINLLVMTKGVNKRYTDCDFNEIVAEYSK